MEKRLLLELRGRTPSQVKELNLDNTRSVNIVGLTDEYTNLEILSLNNAGLTSLKGLPTLPNLRKLELSDNRIAGGLDFLSRCKKITQLNLSGNRIKDIEALKPLAEFSNIKNLDLYNNEVTTTENYKAKVFALIPSLIYLDGLDKFDHEIDDSDLEEMNGNNSDEEEDLDFELGTLTINDDSGPNSMENQTSLPMMLYAVYGLLFHMSFLFKSSDSDGEEEEDEDVSLSAVYNENLEEESSASSLYEASDYADDDDDDEDDDDEQQNNKTQEGAKNADDSPEESTRGKKRKLDDEQQ